jgi:hypothetical protein
MCSKRMKGFIYKITSPSTDKIYVGSTTKTLGRRFSAHKYTQNKNTQQCSSKIILSFGDAVIDCIEEVEFENKKQLRIRERYHIELNRDKCVNIHLPNRTIKEYRLDTADKIKQYRIDNADRIKQYTIDNADRLKEKFNCECGGKYVLISKTRHLKTQKHQNYIASIL